MYMKFIPHLLFILGTFIVFSFTAHSDEDTQNSPSPNAQQVTEEAEEEPECD